MNTWVVGNHPVGHRVSDYKEPSNDKESKIEEKKRMQLLGEKLFFMRARIMAGQADLKDNMFGLKDFKWLAREEVEQQVQRAYWNDIKNMLPAR